MKKNKTNIYVIRNTINKNLVRKGYSMQASYFQTDNGYIDYVYTDLEKDELVFFERNVFSVARWYITTRVRKKTRWRIDFIEAYIKGGKIFVKTKNNAFNSSKIDLEEAV